MGIIEGRKWEVVTYPDGACLVTTAHGLSQPYLAVWAQPDDGRAYRFETRYRMALDLAAFLNGFMPWPIWLGDMERVELAQVLGADGSSITGIGMNDESSLTATALLMDRLGCRAYAPL